MSLAFKPKFPEGFVQPESPEPVRSRTNNSPWSEEDMTRLIMLRAMRVPFHIIGKLLKKANGTCCFMVRENGLEAQILEIQEDLIKEVMNRNIRNRL